MALDPQEHPDDVPPILEVQDVQEVSDDASQLSHQQAVANVELVMPKDRAAPTGWRIDEFEDGQRVYVPPWSHRPPSYKPVKWVAMTKRSQKEAQEVWQGADPSGYALQERRRAEYSMLRDTERLLRATPYQLLVVDGFVDYEFDEVEVSSRCDAERCRLAAVALPATVSLPEVVIGRLSELHSVCLRRLSSGDVKLLLVEMCCEDDSRLGSLVPEGSAVLRITSELDILQVDTQNMVNSIIEFAGKLEIDLHCWISIPCTAGGRWKSSNRSRGIETGDVAKTAELIKACIDIVGQVACYQGGFSWEWPSTNSLWQDLAVQKLINDSQAVCRIVSHAKMGGVLKLKGESVAVKKCFRIFSTSSGVAQNLEGIAKPESEVRFVQAEGKLTNQTAAYPPEMVQRVWRGLQLDLRQKMDPDLIDGRCLLAGVVNNSGVHEVKETYPDRPLWCAVVTRIVGMNSHEAKCKAAQDAISKERDGIMGRGTFGMAHPIEIEELYKKSAVKEAMMGRVFCILGKRNCEMAEDQQSWKARAVFQGNNIRTKSGVDAAQLFQEVANALASFCASRCTLAVAALKGFDVTFRDALQAFLQSRIDGPGRIPTYAELPKSWLPDSWFHDGAKRTQPKYKRPLVLMLLCLYGHPESGALWGKDLELYLGRLGFKPVADWPGVFVHSDGSIVVVYVDDIMLAADTKHQEVHWRAMEKVVEFKEAEQALDRYLGAYHKLSPYNSKVPDAIRTFELSMVEYASAATDRFVAETGTRLTKV
jgi:hypothetical protein